MKIQLTTIQMRNAGFQILAISNMLLKHSGIYFKNSINHADLENPFIISNDANADVYYSLKINDPEDAVNILHPITEECRETIRKMLLTIHKFDWSKQMYLQFTKKQPIQRCYYSQESLSLFEL